MTTPAPPRRRWFRFSLRTLLLAVMAAALLLAYVASYHRLSRRGMQEAKAVHLPGFLYVALEDAVSSKDLTWHHRLAVFYAPLNQLDRWAFDSPHPITCIMWDLD
jgi:hypothetical protein